MAVNNPPRSHIAAVRGGVKRLSPDERSIELVDDFLTATFVRVSDRPTCVHSYKPFSLRRRLVVS